MPLASSTSSIDSRRAVSYPTTSSTPSSSAAPPGRGTNSGSEGNTRPSDHVTTDGAGAPVDTSRDAPVDTSRDAPVDTSLDAWPAVAPSSAASASILTSAPCGPKTRGPAPCGWLKPVCP
eukprot:scaffold26341_cov129-Isochrysis_galbana.AAC.1